MKGMQNTRKAVGRPGFAEQDSLAVEIFLFECRRIVLSRGASVPLWEQLSVQLENLILSGKLAVGSRIPSEPALCDLFGVSKAVVRHAITSLAARGLVVKIPRKGMFVGDRPRESGFVTSNVSLFDDMLARGAKLRTQTFEFVKVLADDEEREALQLKAEACVVRAGRVFWAYGQPITHSIMSFPAEKVPGFERVPIEGKSIQGTIRELYGRRLVRAERWLSAVMPPPEVTQRMELESQDPLIWIESIGFEKDGSPLEYYRAYYNSGAARIHISVSD